MEKLKLTNPEKISGQEGKKTGVLSSEELRVAFGEIAGIERGLQKTETGGLVVTLPEGMKMGDFDISGMTVEQALSLLNDNLEIYEPQIAEEKDEKEPTYIPAWLSGYENLIWRGAHENPLWEPLAEQYKDYVKVGFVRRETKLYPGKGKDAQGKELAPIKNTFSLDEWKILSRIFDEYIELEKKMQSADARERQEAKREILNVLKEENAYRKGVSVEAPKIIKDKITQAIGFIAKTTRGFKKEKIDVDTLSQDAAEILSQLLVLNRTRGDAKERLVDEERMSGIEEFPSFEHILSNLATSFHEQIERGQGISYMIGEAGTGKNIAAEYFAYKTNRPFFWFPCGRGMESMDLMYHYEFDSEEGTKRFLTDLARGIQTPGAIVLIDEVNTLKPQVQAILHGLGDANRAINFDAVRIPAAEGVLVVIASNPAIYGAAGNIGEALLNRTRGLSFTVDYPALYVGELLAIKEKWTKEVLKKKEQEDNTLREYAFDEIKILYGLLPEFKSLPPEKMSKLWDAVVNEHGDNFVELEKDKETAELVKDKDKITKTLKDLKDILEIGDTWRKNYGQRKSGFDVVSFSIRDSIAVVRRYSQTRDVRKAFLDVYDDFRKNPIDGTDVQYQALQNLLNEHLGQ